MIRGVRRLKVLPVIYTLIWNYLHSVFMQVFGAEEGIRTLDIYLGKVTLYPWATPALTSRHMGPARLDGSFIGSTSSSPCIHCVPSPDCFTQCCLNFGAGYGNRTRLISLEGWSITTMLIPHSIFGCGGWIWTNDFRLMRPARTSWLLYPTKINYFEEHSSDRYHTLSRPVCSRFAIFIKIV